MKSALFRIARGNFIVQEDFNNADFSLIADLKDQKSDLLKENAEKIAEIKYIWNQMESALIQGQEYAEIFSSQQIALLRELLYCIFFTAHMKFELYLCREHIFRVGILIIPP